jgi:hypothetical protein
MQHGVLARVANIRRTTTLQQEAHNVEISVLRSMVNRKSLELVWNQHGGVSGDIEQIFDAIKVSALRCNGKRCLFAIVEQSRCCTSFNQHFHGLELSELGCNVQKMHFRWLHELRTLRTPRHFRHCRKKEASQGNTERN